MIYALLVMSSPASGQCAMTAARFARGVLARGHSIKRVFFLDAGTGAGSATAVYPQDESARLQPWVDLAEQHGVELSLCIASALKYGMLDEAEATRYDRRRGTIHPAFTLAGLGQLVDAAASVDRMVSFGG
ncbi:MAG: sulfurtransferase complex subunit TusD [Halioglobus sp.]|nr:sulfurtransferase complex subunit TusD [Halioglobus sp.]MCB1708104.1 sulfurtransferase complex subunit TusD [Halioglobus sp.]MCP5122216.1 sulfurtransferase complex subunit TusD [Pseudomonadales bacterium]MCP5192239.1 sulfurtransferase complex subunit TusD [Pseudomonadales bacterium]